MAKTLHEHVSILDPYVDTDEMAAARAILRQLGASHPEWIGMMWTMSVIISTEGATEIRVVIRDPNPRRRRKK